MIVTIKNFTNSIVFIEILSQNTPWYQSLNTEQYIYFSHS